MAALGLLKRRLLPILLCLVAGAIGGILATERTPKMYAASATLIVNIPQASNTGEALQGVQLSTQLLASYAQVATSRHAAAQVKDQLALPESADAVRAKLAATPVPETLLMTISASDPDPIRASSIADSASVVFIELVSKLESSKRDKVVPSVVDAAVVPSAPVSPRPKLNLALGLIAGGAVAALLALLLEALDRTVKGPAQLSELARAPLLGIVPRIRGEARFPETTVDHPMSTEAEAYRALRTALRFVDVESPLQTILITSPGPNEGKTTTATHFAITLAQSGERVVLVDADLRRGALLESFGLPSGAGVTSVVTGVAHVEDVLQVWRGLVSVIGTGPLPPNPAEILGSQAMASLLDDLRGHADIVVIDAPPVLPVTDAVALSTQVDGVVIVARDSKTARTNIAESRRRLEGVGAHVVGCVLNGVRSRGDLYADYKYLRPTIETPSLGRRITDRLRH